VALALLVAPLAAQGHGPKRYAVAPDRAVVVTREVLGRKGFEVIRVETVGNDQVVCTARGTGAAAAAATDPRCAW